MGDNCGGVLESVRGTQPDALTGERTSWQLMEELCRGVDRQRQDRSGHVRCGMGGPRESEQRGR